MAVGPDSDRDIIAAIATPPGRGGVGIVRLSGPNLKPLLSSLYPATVEPRYAHFAHFTDDKGELIDQGLLLYFPGPGSFTGEDVIELHGHGGPVVMDALLSRVLELGARLAQPGEFSQRSFLHDKIDLAQAEAIADLIDASSREAARGAVRSLQGMFSRRIHSLVEQLIELRTFVEAAIDFPDEEVDFLSDRHVLAGLDGLLCSVSEVRAEAGQGALLRDGMVVVIAGKPNAGKSSLLNALSGRDSAIVTDVAGTTRDVVREHIDIDGMPLHVVDTAGLRDSTDVVEKEGIRRAWHEIRQADRVLLVIDAATDDARHPNTAWPDFFDQLGAVDNLTVVLNKIDTLPHNPVLPELSFPVLPLSARTGEGVEALRAHLKNCMGYQGAGEGLFVARRRHMQALNSALDFLQSARHQLLDNHAGELMAEDLRCAQQALGEITGEFTSDDLLGRIFGSFCIGK